MPKAEYFHNAIIDFGQHKESGCGHHHHWMPNLSSRYIFERKICGHTLLFVVLKAKEHTSSVNT